MGFASAALPRAARGPCGSGSRSIRPVTTIGRSDRRWIASETENYFRGGNKFAWRAEWSKAGRLHPVSNRIFSLAKRDIIDEINARKLRARRDLAAVRMSNLLRAWKTTEPDPGNAAWYPIHAVTIIEVFVRLWIARLIDHGRPFSANAAPITRDLKIDYGVVSAIHGRVVTLGDVIANSISINRLDQIDSYFTAILSQKFLAKLEGIVDPWEARLRSEEPERGPVQPLITAIETVSRDLSRLFEIRHILCHELPFHLPCTKHEISAF
jgi:hypothetical protein